MSDDTIKEWWAPIRNGLITDPRGKHIKAMGPSLPLYLYLHIFADRDKGYLFRKYQTMSEHMGIPVPTLKRWMKQLRSGGYVELTRLGDGLGIQITKFRPIRSIKSGQEKYQITQGEVSDLSRGIKNVTSSSDSKQNGNHACSSNNGTSKESTKESIKDIYRIFEFWNEQNIVQHRVFNKFQSAIKSCLEHFTVEEIIQAIRVYKKILDSSDHYFTHRWTLNEFLSRKNGLEKFLDEAIALKSFASNGNGYRSQADHNSSSSGRLVV